MKPILLSIASLSIIFISVQAMQKNKEPISSNLIQQSNSASARLIPQQKSLAELSAEALGSIKPHLFTTIETMGDCTIKCRTFYLACLEQHKDSNFSSIIAPWESRYSCYRAALNAGLMRYQAEMNAQSQLIVANPKKSGNTSKRIEEAVQRLDEITDRAILAGEIKLILRGIHKMNRRLK